MIELYTSPTPNGYKASIALEEMGIPYNVQPIDLREGDQKQPEADMANCFRVPASQAID
jgi:glutathione S-transferase